MSEVFSTEQLSFLRRLAADFGASRGGATPSGPDAPHLAAMARTEATGKKLADQEKFKREEHPFDAYARLKAQAQAGEYPKPPDNFRWRYHGLFYVAPNQNSYMCRLRIPGGILTHWQMAGLARLAASHGGGYAHVTTRANLQIREIEAAKAVDLIEEIEALGLWTKGSGADNIRNVTGSATAGIDPGEIYDTRKIARDWHFHILNERALYGLPRKFNVAFDGGGAIATLEETNDVGFQAVAVGEGAGVAPGVWFRLLLGGISGHRDLARDTGVICLPGECTDVADAVIRVFIDEGDRTDRNKARLKYVLDAWGFDKFIAAVEEKLGRKLQRVDAAQIAPRRAVDRSAHIGVHAQRQAGLHWMGVALPVGKMNAAQMAGLADVARDFGDGDIRLTVWQNLLVSGIPAGKIAPAQAAVEALGLDWRASSIRAGLVACTGAKGCKFAASDTKGHALQIADHVEAVMTLDQPVNVHLTGCHHSCAQHYIGDIGLIGARVAVNDDGDTVEGYDIVVGGGYGENAKIGREVLKGVKAEETPARVEALLRWWMARRADPSETFQAFTQRHEVAEIRAAFEMELAS